jgi:hypothetical protein
MVAKLEASPEKASFERVHQALSALEMDLVLKQRGTPTSLPNPKHSMKSANGDTW